MKNPSVSGRSRGRIVAPKGLSAASQRLFRDLVGEYTICDRGGVAILASGLISLEQATEAERTIRRDGQTFTDRFGQPRPHPLLAAARDHRAAWLAALRQLNLAVGDPAQPGRPEGT